MRSDRGEEEETRRGEEEKATDIKSNNPHLAGGEKLLSHAEPNYFGPGGWSFTVRSRGPWSIW